MRSVVTVVPLCDNRDDVGNDSNENEGTDGDDVGKEGDDFDGVEDIDDETCDLKVEMLSVVLIRGFHLVDGEMEVLETTVDTSRLVFIPVTPRLWDFSKAVDID